MEIKDRTIALLIDSDNVSRDYYAILLDELSQYGRVTYRRLYGDFSKPKANGWEAVLLEHSIEQVQQITFTKSKVDDKRKEATDSSMIIDAMDILYTGKVDCFCLATSDSDFTKLAMRLRNDSLVVIGAGEKKTPDSFRRACDRFISIDELLTAKKETNSQNAKLKELVNQSKKIITDMAETDGWMRFSLFMQEIYLHENDFSPKIYNHRNRNVASFFESLKDNDKALFIIETINNVTRIKLNK